MPPAAAKVASPANSYGQVIEYIRGMLNLPLCLRGQRWFDMRLADPSFYWFLTIVEQIASTSHHTPILLLRTPRFHILQQCDHPTSAPQSHKQGLPQSQMRLKPFHLYISLSMTVSSTIASMRILGLCTSGTCFALLFSYTKYWETQRMRIEALCSGAKPTPEVVLTRLAFWLAT